MKRRIVLGILTVAILVSASGFGCYFGLSSEALGEQSNIEQETEGVVTQGEYKDSVQNEGNLVEVEIGTTDSGKQTEDEENMLENDAQEGEESQLESDIEAILNGCSRAFICNYMVDESYLMWFYAQYGEESLHAIAEAVEAGESDPAVWYQITGSTMHVLWACYQRDSGYQLDIEDEIIWKDCASSTETVLDFSGDINFSEGWSTMLYMDQKINGIYECFSDALLAEMNQADIMMVNNEFQYSTGGTPLEGKDYVFRADPSREALLDALGVDIVNLANNHMYDYGEEALLDTLQTLQDAGMPYVGAGEDLDEAEEPVYFIANGRKIAIVAATQIERSTNYTKEATEDSAGVLKTLDPEKFIGVIQKAKANSDIVIAYVHWGTEGTNDYEADQQELAEQFAEAGADAIIGGHTHCLQGIEYVGDGVPVIYSLGNFWFNGNKLDTGLAQIRIQQDGSIQFRFLPCLQAGTTVSLVEDTEKQRILTFMQDISADTITIDSDGFVSQQVD